jgi:uncharacterized membrane protein YcaP (DUF421 family)
LNPFDLIVLLSLSNTVQNAMIGDDNSLTGGIIGAFSLLAVNWLLSRLIFKQPELTKALQGRETVLIRDGRVDEKALKDEALTHEELTEALNKNGFNDPEEVSLCKLQPSGTFYVKGKRPSEQSVEMDQVFDMVRDLKQEISALRLELAQHRAN